MPILSNFTWKNDPNLPHTFLFWVRTENNCPSAICVLFLHLHLCHGQWKGKGAKNTYLVSIIRNRLASGRRFTPHINYRVTHQVVPKVLLISKYKFRFSKWSQYQNATSVLMSREPWEKRDVSPCTTPCTFCVCYRRIRCQCHCDFWVRDWGCGCGWGVIWFERYVLQDFPRVHAGSEFWVRKRGSCQTIHGKTNLQSICFVCNLIVKQAQQMM